jgi:hypothetical protein
VTAQLPLDLLGEPDLQGHKHFCAPMCAIWMGHYGADTIDESNLALFRSQPTSCPKCHIDALPPRERRVVLAALAGLAS